MLHNFFLALFSLSLIALLLCFVFKFTQKPQIADIENEHKLDKEIDKHALELTTKTIDQAISQDFVIGYQMVKHATCTLLFENFYQIGMKYTHDKLISTEKHNYILVRCTVRVSNFGAVQEQDIQFKKLSINEAKAELLAFSPTLYKQHFNQIEYI